MSDLLPDPAGDQPVVLPRNPDAAATDETRCYCEEGATCLPCALLVMSGLSRDNRHEVTVDGLVGVLVARYGLPDVYRAVRSLEGFCGNCGVPEENGKVHVAGGMGYCYVEAS